MNMKLISTQRTKGFIDIGLVYFFIFFWMMQLWSCKKKDNVRSTQMQMMVFHASPNSGTIQLFQNLKTFNDAGFEYMNRFETGPFIYYKIDSGFQNYKIKKGISELANALLINRSNTTSFWIFDTASSLRYFLLDDQLDTPGRAKAKIRILHLAPNVDTFNVLLNNAAVADRNWIYFSNDVVNNTSLEDFFNIDSGVYKIDIRRKTPQSILKTYQYHFESNKVYTLVLKGYLNRTGRDSLSVSIIRYN